MRVAYIAETSLDNRSAYTHHVIKMCDAFSTKNCKTTLIIPSIDKRISFKKIKKSFLLTSKNKFLIKKILSFKVSNFLTRILFGFKVANHLRKNCPELIITRSFISSIFFTFFKINHFLEIHSEFRGLTRFFMINLNFLNSRYVLKIILISKALNKRIFKLNKKKFLILHDAVDIKNFKNKKFKNKIKIATYVGSFYKGKGVEFIFELSKILPKVKFYLYGDINTLDDRFKNNKQNKNLIFRNHIEYSQIPKTLAKFEIILMPYSKKVYVKSKSIEVGQYMSPLKLFDYFYKKINPNKYKKQENYREYMTYSQNKMNLKKIIYLHLTKKILLRI